MVKLILADIDNTIMPKGHDQVGERVRAAFHAALDAGVRVGPCSGRGRDWVAPIFGGDEALFATGVTTNGLEVSLDGAMVRKVGFEREPLVELVRAVEGTPHAGVICFEGYTPYLVCGERADLLAAFPRYGEACVEADEVPRVPINKANVFSATDEATTRELVARLNREVEGLDLDNALPTFSNVMPAGINKATGIDLLCEEIGCSLADVVVFGDAGNDLSMLSHVPDSVAVANATPEAAAAARWHIGACADDAVADAVLALAHGEWPFVR